LNGKDIKQVMNNVSYLFDEFSSILKSGKRSNCELSDDNIDTLCRHFQSVFLLWDGAFSYAAIAIARLPPLSPSPSLLLPSPLPLRHPPPSSPSPSPLPPSPLPSSSPASLVTLTINHIVAVIIANALVAVNHLPPSLPSLLPPKPSLSSLHSTLIANAIARFIPVALFTTRHPYPHRHHLAALTLLITCSHC